MKHYKFWSTILWVCAIINIILFNYYAVFANKPIEYIVTLGFNMIAAILWCVAWFIKGGD